MNEFGEWLHHQRIMHDMSQEAFAEKLDVAVMTVHKFETGKMYPSYERLVRICATLGEDFVIRGKHNADDR